MARVNVYVDGLNLYNGALRDTPYRWLDLRKLGQALLKPDDVVQRIRCFTTRLDASDDPTVRGGPVLSLSKGPIEPRTRPQPRCRPGSPQRTPSSPAHHSVRGESNRTPPRRVFSHFSLLCPHSFPLPVYPWCMSRTNIDIDDRACADVMRRYRLTTKRAAVNFALRTLAAEPLSVDEARALRGTGWDGDLETMRSGRPPWS